MHHGIAIKDIEAKKFSLVKKITRLIETGGLSDLTNEEKALVREAVNDSYIRESSIVPGDVVTDDGYHGLVVITRIDGSRFSGYYVVDGVVRDGLDFADFRKVASRAGEWKATRTGAMFVPDNVCTEIKEVQKK